MKIGNYEIGYGHRPMIVCEIGAAHNGSLETALKLITMAKHAGADGVKIQCYLPDTITMDGPGEEFTIQDGPWAGRRLYELYEKAHMPRAWFEPMFKTALACHIPLFASVFSPEDLDFIKPFNPPAYKIASFEANDIPLIRMVDAERKPVIISTGLSDWNGMFEAAANVASDRLIMLHCTSSYPAPLHRAEMGKLPAMQKRFRHVGLSDHSRGTTLGVMATTYGAAMIEKHITLTPDGPGEDDGFAIGPEAFAAFVHATWGAYEAIGASPTPTLTPMNAGVSEHHPLRRSLYVVEDIMAGQLISTWNVRSIRPGAGLAPALLTSVVGRRARVDIARGTPLQYELMEGSE